MEHHVPSQQSPEDMTMCMPIFSMKERKEDAEACLYTAMHACMIAVIDGAFTTQWAVHTNKVWPAVL